MAGRLRLDLHFEDGGPLVVGGAWTWYQPADQRIAARVFPFFAEPLDVDTASDRLIHDALEHVGHQLAF